MKGYLFGDHEVEIDKRSHELGGAWQGELRDGKPCAWDPESLAFFHDKMYSAGQGAVILDVGANTGSFCLLPAIKRGCFTVLAFEPQPKVILVLVENIKLNQLQGIVMPFYLALSDCTDEMTMFVDKRPGHSGLATFHRSSVWLNPREIDEIQMGAAVFDEMFHLHRLDMIKVDTEGHDLYALRGMEWHIKRYWPGIMFESWPKEPVFPYLASLGYPEPARVGRDNWWTTKR